MKSPVLKLLFFSITIVLLTSFALKQGKHAVSPEDLKNWISFLSSDAMKGRANGSPEMKTAADWISGKFSEEGLKPPAGWKDYIQNYNFSSRQRQISERNVVGVLEGTDPELKNQYIIVSAHFDHIGIRRGTDPDTICNGADDNGAGTCTLIGIARTIRLLKLKPGRTVIFAAFSGEESGMRGSRYFASNPPVSLKDVMADINFEMIGHSEELGKGRYYMTGCKNSNLDDIIRGFDSKSGIVLVDTIKSAEELFYASDNIAFSRLSSKDGIAVGIPSGTFATSTMAPWIHTVKDEAAYFDFDNYANLVDYFSRMLVWLSRDKTQVEWTVKNFTRP